MGKEFEKENRRIYLCNSIILLSSCNYHNIANQLYSNIKFKKMFKAYCSVQFLLYLVISKAPLSWLKKRGSTREN